MRMLAIGIGTSRLKRCGSARRRGRSFLAGASAVLLCSLLGGQAFADCGSEIGALSKKRQDLIDDLNKVAKSSPKGQLDPTTSCPKLRALAAAEQALFAYLQKNKEWCTIPDETVTNFGVTLERSKSVAAKACAFAEQMKKGLAAGASQAQKLPAGPL
jgi:hypothetical protein